MGAVAEGILKQYDYLASHYARKIWNEHKLGIERSDIEQELRIRLWLAIKRYGENWRDYKKGLTNKPIPIKFYLKTTMINKSRDIIDSINKSCFHRMSDVMIEPEVDPDEIKISKVDICIGAQRLSDLFASEQKRVFRLLVITDFDEEKTTKAYKGESCETIIEEVKQTIRMFLGKKENEEIFVK